MEHISVVMPYHIIDEELKQLTRDALFSIKGQYDELILVDDASSVPCDEFTLYTKKFIRNGKRLGYILSANEGIKQARSNYILLMCNDTKLIKGSLQDLCGKGYVFPRIEGKDTPFWDGACYMFPRSIKGLYDERYRIYFGDLDKFYEANLNHIPLYRQDNVVVWHKTSATTNKLRIRDDAYYKDKLTWIHKWDFDPLERYYELIQEI